MSSPGGIQGHCRHGVRKAKANLELNLVRDVKHKKGFHTFISPDWGRDLVTKNIIKAEVLDTFCASILTSKINFRKFLLPDTCRKLWSKNYMVEEDQVREYLI